MGLFEEAHPDADRLDEDVDAVAGSRVELGDHRRRVGGVPVAGADRVERDAEQYVGAGVYVTTRVGGTKSGASLWVVDLWDVADADVDDCAV